MVLHIFPYAIGNAFEFELDVVGVLDGVDRAAVFYPPVVVVLRERLLVVELDAGNRGFRLVIVEVVIGKMVCPVRSCERMVLICLSELEQDGIAHCLGIASVFSYK